MEPLIRIATPTDAERMLPAYRSGLEFHVAARPDTFRTATDEELVQGLTRLMTTENNRFLIAELDDCIIGLVGVVVRERLATPISVADSWLELDQISVLPAQQRQGVGRALVERVIEEARALGLARVELSSWAFNTGAHRAFERCGFRAKSVRFELSISRTVPS